MIKIEKLYCEGLQKDIVTDNKNPIFSFSLSSDKSGVGIKKATFNCNGYTVDVIDQKEIIYKGKELKPYSKYVASVEVETNDGDKDFKNIEFETGKLGEKWLGKWISDGEYTFKEKKISPLPLVFHKSFNLKKKIKEAKVYATAFGIYNLYLNDEKVGNRYFAPGFTNYKKNLMYQTYDVTKDLSEENDINIVVSGGWAVGSFVFTRNNKLYEDKQSLLFELRVVYEDGTIEYITSDESWEVTNSSMFKMCDLYDGETYDALLSFEDLKYHKASFYRPKNNPELFADYGVNVVEHEIFRPYLICSNGKLIYDFKQNFAGIVSFRLKNIEKGRIIIIRHAEILNPDGSLNTKFLRTAKTTITYKAKGEEGENYKPSFTYMGFRYIEVSGVKAEEIEIEGIAIYSDVETIGHFECDNKMLNQLQSNIMWSSKSNFVDIPTDCPQRDERMGWTGDIAVFAPTAMFNFKMDRFLNKWLKDLRSEQLKTGGIPNTIPSAKYGFPVTMPTKAIDFWGDATVLVPYNEYLYYGNKNNLQKMSGSMEKYVKASQFRAKFLSVGENRYIWKGIDMLHFGDWVAPDLPKMSEWQARHPWTATASLRNINYILSKTFSVLANEDKAKYYLDYSNKVKDAYIDKFTDKNGKLIKEFQTGYVLPLYYEMFDKNTKRKAALNLANLIKKNNYCIGTGFPGTPYILFALSDNDEKDTAFKMLLNDKCPSWLYEVKVGATTIWERWDGLNEKGECEIKNDGTDNMVSYNHYASGAIGDFLYKRIAGIETIEPGFKVFKIKPILGGNIKKCKANTYSPYGLISVDWEIINDKFNVSIIVPINATCILTLPSGKELTLINGKYHFNEMIKN